MPHRIGTPPPACSTSRDFQEEVGDASLPQSYAGSAPAPGHTIDEVRLYLMDRINNELCRVLLTTELAANTTDLGELVEEIRSGAARISERIRKLSWEDVDSWRAVYAGGSSAGSAFHGPSPVSVPVAERLDS